MNCRASVRLYVRLSICPCVCHIVRPPHDLLLLARRAGDID